MHAILPWEPSPAGGGYVPYFYQAGLFQAYAMPRSQHSPRPYDRALGVYDFTSDHPAGLRSEPLQTVDQIIAHGYLAAPRGDPVTAILSDRRETSWLGLDDIIGQIRRRYEIYERDLHEIGLGKCAATNSLYAHWAYHGPPTARHFYSRHKRLQELYEQERDERTSLWKDVSRLRLALPETAQAYLSSHRKLQALDDVRGEAP